VSPPRPKRFGREQEEENQKKHKKRGKEGKKNQGICSLHDPRREVREVEGGHQMGCHDINFETCLQG